MNKRVAMVNAPSSAQAKRRAQLAQAQQTRRAVVARKGLVLVQAHVPVDVRRDMQRMKADMDVRTYSEVMQQLVAFWKAKHGKSK